MGRWEAGFKRAGRGARSSLSTGRKIPPGVWPIVTRPRTPCRAYNPSPPETGQGEPSAPCRDCDRRTSPPPNGARMAPSAPVISPLPAPPSSEPTCSAPARSAPAFPRTHSASCRTRSTVGPRSTRDLADAVAAAMKDWALEKGATHYTHLFQPMTGSTAEKHDSFLAPDRRRHGARRVQRQGAGQGRARRLELPLRRHPRHLRGPRLHRLGPDQPGVHPREPQRRDPLSSRPPSCRGPARPSTRRPRCSARWRRSEQVRRCASCKLFGNTATTRSSPPSAPSRNTS